jgi:hypothetical protein
MLFVEEGIIAAGKECFALRYYAGREYFCAARGNLKKFRKF